MQPKVAISSDFFNSVLKLPRTQQEKAAKLMETFRLNPKSPGINYETIQVARDKNLRSVRIDQAYRAIVLAPEKGDVYILLWADLHDDAYKWASDRIFKINPENGVLQILDTQYVDEAKQIQQSAVAQENTGLFTNIRDRYLVRLGVPEELLPLVRQVLRPLDLEELKVKLPDEAYEALALLADGISLEEVMSVYDVSLQDTPSTIDTNNFFGIICETGLIGLGLYLLLIYQAFKKANKKNIYNLAMIASVFAALVDGFFNVALQYAVSGMIFFMFLGLLSQKEDDLESDYEDYYSGSDSY